MERESCSPPLPQDDASSSGVEQQQQQQQQGQRGLLSLQMGQQQQRGPGEPSTSGGDSTSAAGSAAAAAAAAAGGVGSGSRWIPEGPARGGAPFSALFQEGCLQLSLCGHLFETSITEKEAQAVFDAHVIGESPSCPATSPQGLSPLPLTPRPVNRKRTPSSPAPQLPNSSGRCIGPCSRTQP